MSRMCTPSYCIPLSQLPDLLYCQNHFGDKVHDSRQAQKEDAVDVVNVHCRYS